MEIKIQINCKYMFSNIHKEVTVLLPVILFPHLDVTIREELDYQDLIPGFLLPADPLRFRLVFPVFLITHFINILMFRELSCKL